jgi:hypothetical protein
MPVEVPLQVRRGFTPAPRLRVAQTLAHRINLPAWKLSKAFPEVANHREQTASMPRPQ